MLDQIADTWSVLILATLCHGPLRFNALKRGLAGVTQTALTQSLRRLGRKGIVTRRLEVTKPIAESHAITPLGRTLEPLLRALDAWTQEHSAEVGAAQQAFDRVGASAKRAKVVTTKTSATVASPDAGQALMSSRRLDQSAPGRRSHPSERAARRGLPVA